MSFYPLPRQRMITLRVLCLVLAAAFCGCDRNPSPADASSKAVMEVKRSDLANLRKGLEREQVHKLLGSSGTHQFTARLDDGDYECVSYSFEKSFMRYYFVFKDGSLDRIIKSPPFEVEEKPYLGVSREVKKPVQQEKRLREVFAEESLFGERLVAALERELSELSGSTRSFNVLPAFLLASKEFTQAEDKIGAAYRRNAALAAKFDPARVKLGDREDDLRPIYGTPLSVMEDYAGKTRTYRFGSNEPLRVNPAHRFSGVVVVVENGIVVRIFSHDFFD